MSANPAATLQAPTPIFLIAVGYSSAVYTGIIVLPALIVNFPKIKSNQRNYLNFSSTGKKFQLPIITNVIFSHKNSSLPSITAAPKQDKPAAKNVLQKSHFLPVLVMM